MGKVYTARQPELLQEEQEPAWVPLSPLAQWRKLFPSKKHISLAFLIFLPKKVHYYGYQCRKKSGAFFNQYI